MPRDLPPVSRNVDSLFEHVLRLGWRADAIDEWREVLDKHLREDVDRRLSLLESDVVTEKEARALREALVANRSERSSVRLTKAQQLAGVLIFLVALADLLRGLL